jgi:hypothetical protein
MFDLPRLLHIDHIIDGVYISGWRATLYADYLRKAKITNVLKLYSSIPHFPSDFNTLENVIDDSELIPAEKLQCGTEYILEHVNAESPVLVMCGRGVNRSSTFVLAYLVARGNDLHDAFRLLRERHKEATPHPIMWESLIQYFKLDYTVEEALTWMKRD